MQHAEMSLCPSKIPESAIHQDTDHTNPDPLPMKTKSPLYLTLIILQAPWTQSDWYWLQ